jgi:serine/tyrosine/threonine adenylyltransferase
LNAASEHGDLSVFRQLLEILQKPFEEQSSAAGFEFPATPEERVLHTFCGT